VTAVLAAFAPVQCGAGLRWSRPARPGLLPPEPSRRVIEDAAELAAGATEGPCSPTPVGLLTAALTTGESLITWGKAMRLDNSFQSPAGTPTLGKLRTLLTAAYPPVGPIYA
jgi:hypothetical protein